MNEIAFALCRARPKNRSRECDCWVYGYPITVGSGRIILVESAGEPTSCLAGPDLVPMVYHEVDPDSICRFSGFYDESGRRIFQNDILLNGCDENGSTYHYMVLVGFVNGAWYGVHEGASLETAVFNEMNLAWESDGSLVIGNTLDNSTWAKMWQEGERENS